MAEVTGGRLLDTSECELGDGDLVRLARAGDPVAFRLLVERHLPMARARAAGLCRHPDEVDDVIQDSFLQAFVALDRLRDPDRFSGWLGGIVLNVCRAAWRRNSPTLLADWPEQLHPVSADGLPSADDLDRAEALRAAVADLPAGQRQAVERFYYADLPTDRVAESPGAAKASLHKARRRMRAYLTAHRPDLVPTSRRHMTPLRIARAVPMPGLQPTGVFNFDQVLVVLADDAGHRMLPIWLTGHDGDSLWRILDQPRTQAETAELPAEPASEVLADALLRAADIALTAVDIDELGPEVTAARLEVAGPTGSRRVLGRLGQGLALAAAAGAPVRVADTTIDRLAVPTTGDDLLGPFLQPEQPPTSRRWRLRFEPRNLEFTDGLDRWTFGGSFRRAAQGGGHGQADAPGSHWQDYTCSASNGRAVLASAVPRPFGSAYLCQTIFADDYRGATVVLSAELRTEGLTARAGITLLVADDRLLLPGHDSDLDGEVDGCRVQTITDDHDWARREVTAEVPADAQIIRFGITLTGTGRVELRNVTLTRGT